MYSQKPLLHKKQREYKGGLRTLSIDVTNECNMNCAHCYASTFKSRMMLDYRHFKKAIKEFQSLGGFHFILQGGEPIISSRLWDILGAIDIPSSYVNLVSNGWDMHGGKVAWAKGIGIDKIAFSLDSGLTPPQLIV